LIVQRQAYARPKKKIIKPKKSRAKNRRHARQLRVSPIF